MSPSGERRRLTRPQKLTKCTSFRKFTKQLRKLWTHEAPSCGYTGSKQLSGAGMHRGWEGCFSVVLPASCAGKFSDAASVSWKPGCLDIFLPLSHPCDPTKFLVRVYQARLGGIISLIYFCIYTYTIYIILYINYIKLQINNIIQYDIYYK